MVIRTKEQISAEVIKISSDTGSAFFLRTVYLKLVSPEEIEHGAEFYEEREEDIIDAGLSYAAETKAEEYLARCEQSRYGLTAKLLNKSYEKKYVQAALDFLEAKNYLSDVRFSRAWLNSRLIGHSEGRTKLLAELLSRGISKEDANVSLDEFFEEHGEEELCKRCLEKLLRTNSDREKIPQKLQAKGFSWSLVKKVLSEMPD